LWRVTHSHVGGDFQFSYATEFNEYIGEWDVSSVTDMSYMVRNTCLLPTRLFWRPITRIWVSFLEQFVLARTFNQGIGRWKVGAVTTMRQMVRAASTTTRQITELTLARTNDNLFAQFYHASAFNRNIGDWDVGSVSQMNYMVRMVAV
jgi:surface protein